MQLADLVRRIRRGEKEAVKELVATYGSGVYQRAYERTKDKELAREAARQTFGQFVAIVQQQPEDDGWSLWFGDLIERNIATYAQISTDMRTIESELDQELDTARVAKPVAAPLRFDTDANEPVAPLRNAAETSYERAPQTKKGGLRDEIFDEAYQRSEIYDDPYQKKNKKPAKVKAEKPGKANRADKADKPAKGGSSHGLTIFLLIIVSVMLLWVVAGVAMSIGLIPTYDLGYTWFNANVFRLF